MDPPKFGFLEDGFQLPSDVPVCDEQTELFLAHVVRQSVKLFPEPTQISRLHNYYVSTVQ